MGEDQVLETRLSCAASCTGACRPGLGHPPGPGQDLDLFRVLGIPGFALDRADPCEDRNGHDASLHELQYGMSTRSTRHQAVSTFRRRGGPAMNRHQPRGRWALAALVSRAV